MLRSFLIFHFISVSSQITSKTRKRISMFCPAVFWSKFMTQFIRRQFPNTDLVYIPSSSNKSALTNNPCKVAHKKSQIQSHMNANTNRNTHTKISEYHWLLNCKLIKTNYRIKTSYQLTIGIWRIFAFCWILIKGLSCWSVITLARFDPLSHRAATNFDQNSFCIKNWSTLSSAHAH